MGSPRGLRLRGGSPFLRCNPRAIPSWKNRVPMDEKKLSRYFFFAVLIGTTVVFFRMVRVFLIPILLAAVFATIFYPLYEWLLRRLRGKKTLAAFLCCFLLL